MGVARVRLIVGVAVLGFVLALVLGSAGLFGGGRALGSSTTITVIGGDVSVRHGATSQFVAAVDGEVLNAGDAVRTGVDARAVLTYFEGSTVTVEPSTELAIDTAAARGNDTIVQMTQNAGRTWHVVTKLVTGNSKYEVRTPASTASVRGTAFTVETDGTTTTITTTEGTVIDQVPDPQNPGRTIDVPVPAGQQHSQSRGQGAGPTQQTPEPDRKVTITLSEQNTIIIDTLGRANGFDQNGKRRLETPGAKLEVIDGRLVITLPNVPEGLLRALTRKGGDVDITTVVTDHGQSSTSNGKLNADENGRGNVDVGGGTSNNPNASPTATPGATPTDSATPAPTQAAGGGGGAPGGTSGGNTGSSSGGAGNQGQGQGQGSGTPQGGGEGQGGNPQGGGQGQGGKPTPTPGFVPPTSLPTIPVSNPTSNPGGGNPGGGGGNPAGGGGGGGPATPPKGGKP